MPEIDPFPNVSIKGDLDKEVWAAYLDPQACLVAAMDYATRCHCFTQRPTIRTVRIETVWIPEPPTVQFLIGHTEASRKVAVSRWGRCGVVYVLEDDGTPNFQRRPDAVAAFTLGAFIWDLYINLQLDAHRNNRLA